MVMAPSWWCLNCKGLRVSIQGNLISFWLKSHKLSTARSAHGCPSSKRVKPKRYTDPTETETILNYGQTHGGKCWKLHCPLLLCYSSTHWQLSPGQAAKKPSEEKSFHRTPLIKVIPSEEEWKDLCNSKPVSPHEPPLWSNPCFDIELKCTVYMKNLQHFLSPDKVLNMNSK